MLYSDVAVNLDNSVRPRLRNLGPPRSSYSLPGLQLMATSVNDYERSQARTNRETRRIRLISKRGRDLEVS